jgi:hypothetical protein
MDHSALGPDGLTASQRAARWATIEESIATVRQSIVPLYGPRARRVPYHGGCGVVVRLRDRLFIFSASHVHLGLEENAVGEILVATSTTFVPVVGQVYRTNGVATQPDSLDAAVLELTSGEGLEALRAIAHPITRSNIRATPEADADIVTLGYPHRDATRTDGARVVPLQYEWEGPSLEHAAYSSLGLRPDHHVTMKLDLKQVVSDNGTSHRSLSPAGVSGSGMWRWLPGQTARLEGIYTDARDDCFIGMHVSAHLILIQKYNPEAFAEFLS